jgi:NitT/TauT family transport system permease protein
MENNLFLDVLASLQRLFVSYIPAAVLGSLLGYLIGINASIYQVLRRLLQIPHSIPPVAILPLALIVLQEKEPAVVLIVFIATLWTIIVNMAIGMRHFRRQDNNFRVAIFHSFHALKVGIWVAWLTVISTEMLIGPKGLGFIVWESYKAGNISYVIQGIIYIGIIGFLLDQVIDFTGYILSQIVLDGRKP